MQAGAAAPGGSGYQPGSGYYPNIPSQSPSYAPQEPSAPPSDVSSYYPPTSVTSEASVPPSEEEIQAAEDIEALRKSAGESCSVCFCVGVPVEFM